MSEAGTRALVEDAIPLRDGRRLGYAEYGDPRGRPLLYFHGIPGCRLEAAFLANPAVRQGVRLIGIDRPGMGLSSYQRGRRILDWPDDVLELARSLGLGRFSIIAFSGGSPFAAACAYKIPDRMIACGLVSGVGPIQGPRALLAQTLPWISMPLMRRFFRDDTHARESLARFAAKWRGPDAALFPLTGVRDLMAASLAGAFSQGARGAAHEATLFGRPWGFRLEELSLSGLHLWHGEADEEIPIEVAKAVAARLPTCKAAFHTEGHISLIVNRGEEIVSALTAPTPG